MFLGYKVNTKGIKVCLDKADAILSLPSPKCLKDMQKLNGKLASLNKFLAKSTEKSLPFFKTVKKYTKKSDFHWTEEAEFAFKEMKQLIAKLPMLTAPEEKEELIVYLAVAKEAEGYKNGELGEYAIHYRPRVSVKGQILANVIVERPKEDSLDTPIEVEEELPKLWILFTDGSSCADGSEAGLILTNPEGTEFTYALKFRSTNLHSKGSRHDPVLVKELKKKSINDVEVLVVVEEEGDTWMTSIYEYLTKETLPADVNKERVMRRKSQRFGMINGVMYKKYFLGPWPRSSCANGSRAGLILINPEGAEFTYALRFRFEATNNEAEYEALIAGLRIAEQMGVKNLQANVDSRLLANQVNGAYIAKEADLIRYLEKVRTLTNGFRMLSIKQVPKSENKKADAMSKIASTSFAHLSKQVLVEELKEKSINEVEVLAVVEEEGDTWMTPIYEYLTEETLPAKVNKARAVRRKSQRFAVINGVMYKKYFLGPWLQFGLPGEIISDNGKQFRDNPFKDWCEKLCIRQRFSFVKHPQENRLVERANRSLGEGIKARLDARSKNWMEEISHVLWSHRTMIKSSNGDTPFSLTYGTEAVILAKIGMPILRIAEVDVV
ncbi:reverse transcriptase domain-containing protein [Tanacetum coccineum]